MYPSLSRANKEHETTVTGSQTAQLLAQRDISSKNQLIMSLKSLEVSDAEHDVQHTGMLGRGQHYATLCGLRDAYRRPHDPPGTRTTASPRW